MTASKNRSDVGGQKEVMAQSSKVTDIKRWSVTPAWLHHDMMTFDQVSHNFGDRLKEQWKTSDGSLRDCYRQSKFLR